MAPVTYPAGWRGKRSPTACTAAVGRRARCRPSAPRACAASTKARAAAATTAARARRSRSVRAGACGSALALGALARARDRLGGRGLVLRLERGLRREQAADTGCEVGARAAGRPADLALDDRADARHRQLGARVARRRHALRLDHAAADGPVAPPALLPLDPTRPRRCRSRGTGRRRSTPPSRSGAPSSRSGRSATSPGLQVNHVIVVDFGDFKELIDALGGIDDRTCRSRSVRTASTAPTRRRRSATNGRAGGSRRATSTWTASARSSTRASARTCSTRRDGLHARRAPAGRDRRGHARSSRRSGRSCAAVQGSSYVKPLATDLLDQPARPARLGEVPRLGLELACTAGSAATSAAAEPARRARTTARRSRCSSGSRRHSRRRVSSTGCVDRPPASVARNRSPGRTNPGWTRSGLCRLLRVAAPGSGAESELRRRPGPTSRRRRVGRPPSFAALDDLRP